MRRWFKVLSAEGSLQLSVTGQQFRLLIDRLSRYVDNQLWRIDYFRTGYWIVDNQS